MLKARSLFLGTLACGGVVIALLVGGSLPMTQAQGRTPANDEPEAKNHRDEAGDAKAGREVFRFETFGNEDFWTDAMRLPQGVKAAKVTPLDALKVGLSVDADAIDPALASKLAAEVKTDLSAKNAPLLNDPSIAQKLIEMNAVIGVVAKGGKVGVSCAICHTITDKSVFDMPKGGSVGRRIDGPAALTLNMGKLLSLAENSRAYYPNLQLELGGKTIGRALKGITKDSTEAEVDAYLSNPKFYPVGTFDETQDGHGNSVVNTPLFRQDLAGPYGSAGEFAKLENISNASYTTNLDPTTLVTPEGRQFMKMKGGAAGEELVNNYAKILEETGVKGYPFVKATTGHKVGDLASPVGRKVDPQKVRDMSAYLKSLPAPKGAKVDAKAAARGRELFHANCTKCHNEDQSQPVPATLVDLKELWPAYAPNVLARREPPLSPIVDSPGGFDDKMIVVDASDRGGKRGNALPLLLDLARKEVFLHDASVPGLNSLFNPKRGANEPHPFYLKDAAQRADMVAFLQGLDTGEAAMGKKDDAPAKTDAVYVVGNDPVEGGNAVLAYLSDGRGNLTPLPGSPFKTGGTGYATKYNLPHFGPFDLDQNIIANPERSRLFVTNGGSDTVAVFDVQDDGGLKPVKGSPFPSGGKNPVSLGLVGDRLYVVNKNDDPGRDMTKTLPNYTCLRVGKDGSLTPIPNSTLELPTASRSPTQALVVEGKFLFDGDFGSFPLPSRVEMWGKSLLKDSASSIRSFKINSDGTLHQHPPLLAPEGAFDGGMDVDGDGKPDPLIFGLQVHPKKKLIYIGFVTAAKIGVYRYDDEGRLTFIRSVPNKGKLVCWIKINKAGTLAYTTNNADDTVSVYDLSDAETPKEIQTLLLRGHGHPYQLDMSPDERSLYVVKHRTFNETPRGDGSVLNVLAVGKDGMLEENDSSPVTLPVRNDLLARPQGVLVLRLK